VDTFIQSLRALVGADQLISDPEELLVYECDGLTHYRERPRAVVFPRSTEEVSELMRLLAREKVSFAPRGAGTGLSGGALAVGGGVQIGLSRMRGLLEVDVPNRLAVVQTGMVNAQLSRAVAHLGLHYAPDPSSQGACTIGGNIAENAGGIHCLKYGTTVDHILGARVVLADGSIVDLGGFGSETAGLDLVGVFVGSEGTFGIATEATVRLTPTPPSVRTLLAEFTDIDDASRSVSAIIAKGMVPAALEMVDGATIRAVEASIFAAGLPLDAEAALLVELDGLDAGLDDEAALVESICRQSGARGVRHAANEAERKKLWAARKGAFGAMGRIMPDMMLQDAVVPRSRLPEVLAETYRIAAKYKLRLANVFHAGDGNLHPIMCYDSRDHDEVVRVREAGREIVETCVRAGGTITGEHGVGLDKSDYLPYVFSEETMGVMLQVRAAFDPSGLCNPGKVIPVLRGCGEARLAVESKSNCEKAAHGNGRPIVRGETTHTTPEIELGTIAGSEKRGASVRARHGFSWDSGRRRLSDVIGDSKVVRREGPGETLVVTPASLEELCDVLRLASSEGWTVAPSGAGTFGSDAMNGCDIILKTTGLARVIEHSPADLVATVEAGVTLADFNRTLASAGQWLALDPPDDGRATVGAVAATGVAGAQSFGYGLPRSKVLGMSVALSDGRHIRVGGRVVKNVAGYDLCKLFVGSRGTLGVITELTFRLSPRPAHERTLVVRSPNVPALLASARAIIATPLFPVAAEVLSSGAAAMVGAGEDENSPALLLRFSGTDATLAYQLSSARSLITERIANAKLEAVTSDSGIWAALAALSLDQTFQVVCRVSVLPTRLDSILALVRGDHSHQDGVWHAGAGDGRLRVLDSSGRDEAQFASELEELQTHARELKGQMFVERAPANIVRKFDSWSATVAGSPIMARLKAELDPGNTLPEC
jgi:glycolate oxidase subunit GlcD